MNWAGLCRVPGAGDRARAVLDALAWWAADAGDPNAGRAFPPVEIPEGHAACWRGIEEIAARADADPRTVRRILKRFEEAGLIRRQRRHRVDGETARRTTDVIYLDLTAEPARIERDTAQTERRRAAALGVRARRAAAGTPSEDTMPSEGPLEDRLSPGPRGQVVPCVETDLGGGARGHLAGGPEGIVSPPLEGIVSGRSTDTTYDTRQDTGSSPQPGTALAPGDVACGQPPLGPYEPVDEADAAQLTRSLGEFGNRYDRRLPPNGTGWSPLRRGSLGDAAYDGMVERLYALLTRRLHPQIPEHWWRQSRGGRDQVWRLVRKAMLDERNGSTIVHPADQLAEEVA